MLACARGCHDCGCLPAGLYRRRSCQYDPRPDQAYHLFRLEFFYVRAYGATSYIAAVRRSDPGFYLRDGATDLILYVYECETSCEHQGNSVSDPSSSSQRRLAQAKAKGKHRLTQYEDHTVCTSGMGWGLGLSYAFTSLLKLMKAFNQVARALGDLQYSPFQTAPSHAPRW